MLIEFGEPRWEAWMGSFPLLPEVASADVVLVRRRVLGGPGDQQVSGQISIGRSEAMRLRPDSAGVDAELARMLARDEEKYHYHLVLLSCTFRTGSAPVVSARLSVALRRDHGDGVADAVVWSMDPLRASTPVTDRLKLGIDLNGKFVVERTREIPQDLLYLVAEGEGENQAEWAFTATSAVALAGVHRLSLVTRTSAQVACHADLALGRHPTGEAIRPGSLPRRDPPAHRHDPVARTMTNPDVGRTAPTPHLANLLYDLAQLVFSGVITTSEAIARVGADREFRDSSTVARLAEDYWELARTQRDVGSLVTALLHEWTVAHAGDDPAALFASGRAFVRAATEVLIARDDAELYRRACATADRMIATAGPTAAPGAHYRAGMLQLAPYALDPVNRPDGYAFVRKGRVLGEWSRPIYVPRERLMPELAVGLDRAVYHLTATARSTTGQARGEMLARWPLPSTPDTWPWCTPC